MKRSKNELICPKCKAKEILSITYGRMREGDKERSEKGEVYFAGCKVRSEKYYCKKCGNKF